MYIVLDRERQSDRQIDRQTDRERLGQRDTPMHTQCTVLVSSILSILYSLAIDSPPSTPALNDIQLRISDLSIEYDVHTEIGRCVMYLTYKVLY